MKWLHELRLGLRVLLRHPGLSFAAFLSLALGVGALTAIFSVISGLLLEPLPYAAPDRLVQIWESDLGAPERRMGASSFATFADWQRETRSFEMMAALLPVSLSFTADSPAESLFSRRVTQNYFDLFGVEPFLGRTFSAEETRDEARVVILSHDLWRTRFAEDRQILGRKIELDNEAYEVIGVLPVFFSPLEPAPVRMWAPLAMPAEPNRRGRPLAVWARLAPGVSVDDAKAELQTLGAELRQRHPQEMEGRGAGINLVTEMLVGHLRSGLVLLFAAGAFVLLMVCGNVVHLLLVRALARRGEMAVRTALGAGKVQLLRQLLVENLILGVVGGLGGLLLAQLALELLKTLVPVSFGLPRLDRVDIDGWALLFTLGISLTTVLLFGLLPARMAFRRVDLNDELKAGSGRTSGGRRGQHLRGALVVTQIALVLVLLIGSGLMMQSFAHLKSQMIAEEPEQLLTLRTSLRGPDYREASQRVEFFRRAQEEIGYLAEVEAVGATDLFVLGVPKGSEPFQIVGQPPAAQGAEPTAFVQIVTPTYLEALGVSLLDGRGLNAQDRMDTPPVALVNQRFASTFLSGGSPVGQAVVLSSDDMNRGVVGVVEDIRAFKHPKEPMPTIYIPHAQRPSPVMTFAVRTPSRPESIVRNVQSAIGSLDPLMATYAVKSLESGRAEADWQSRFILVLLGVFAVLALVLAVTGIYAVMAYSAAQRTQEFGIRIAFGAEQGSLIRLVLQQIFRLTAIGLACGLALSYLLMTLLEKQLYGVKGTDLGTYVALTLALALVVVISSVMPARRALSVDPVASLRQE